MALISVHQLLLATKGKKFEELVFYRARALSFRQLEEAVILAANSLPHHLKIESEDILEKLEPTINRCEFFKTDCDIALRYILSETRSHLIQTGHDFSDKTLIKILDLIIINTAYSIRQNLKEDSVSGRFSFPAASASYEKEKLYAGN